MTQRVSFISLILVVSVAISGCNSGGGGGNSSDPNIGFFLIGDRFEQSQTTGSTIVVPTIMRAQGQFIEPQGTIRGTVESFPVRDIGPAADRIVGAKVPAKWRITYVEAAQPGRIPCQDGIRTVERNVGVGELERLTCTARVFPVTLIPNSVDVQSPPTTIEIDVEGISSEHGQPQVAMLNEFGQLQFAVPATIIESAKHRIRFTVPNMSAFYNGVYSVSVNNVRSDGSWNVIGVGELSVYGNEAPPLPQHPNPCVIPAECLF